MSCLLSVVVIIVVTVIIISGLHRSLISVLEPEQREHNHKLNS